MASGTTMTLLISALPQWRQEKWAGSMSDGHSVRILTRESGQHIMVFKGQSGSYILDALAATQPQYFRQNPLVMLVVAPLCACLLICTARLMAYSWFLVGIGGLVMLYNVYAAKMQRTAEESGLKIKQIQSKPVFMVTPEDGEGAVLNTQRQLPMALQELQEELQELIPEAVPLIMLHWQALSSGCFYMKRGDVR